jgi:hypothetical protein
MKKLLPHLPYLLPLLFACGPIAVNVPVPGPSGPQGPVGEKGRDGSDCGAYPIQGSMAPNGGALIRCDNGTDAIILNGSDGQNGSPGTVVAPIKFCHASCAATSYPNNFPEVGFKIDGKIWAVYSKNGGFLTEIVPGRYSSQGVGCSCTFVVNNDGTVTEEL